MTELPTGAPAHDGYIDVPMLPRRRAMPQATIDEEGNLHIPCLTLADLGLRPGREIPRQAPPPPTAADFAARMRSPDALMRRMEPIDELAELVAAVAGRLRPEEIERFVSLGVHLHRCTRRQPPLLRSVEEIDAWTEGLTKQPGRRFPVLGEIGE